MWFFAPLFLSYFYLLTLVINDLPSIGNVFSGCFSFPWISFELKGEYCFSLHNLWLYQTYWFFMIIWTMFQPVFLWSSVLLRFSSVIGSLVELMYISILVLCAAAIAMEITTFVCTTIGPIYAVLVSNGWTLPVRVLRVSAFFSQKCYFKLWYQNMILICPFVIYTFWTLPEILPHSFQKMNILFLRSSLGRPVNIIAKALFNLGNLLMLTKQGILLPPRNLALVTLGELLVIVRNKTKSSKSGKSGKTKNKTKSKIKLNLVKLNLYTTTFSRW